MRGREGGGSDRGREEEVRGREGGGSDRGREEGGRRK